MLETERCTYVVRTCRVIQTALGSPIFFMRAGVKTGTSSSSTIFRTAESYFLRYLLFGFLVMRGFSHNSPRFISANNTPPPIEIFGFIIKSAHENIRGLTLETAAHRDGHLLLLYVLAA